MSEKGINNPASMILPNSGMSSLDKTKTYTLLQYLHQISGQEKELDIILIDHCYAKPWTAHFDTTHAKPARMLFMKNIPRNVQSVPVGDVEIDVESLSPPIMPVYDNVKTHSLMAECDKFLRHNMNHDLEEDEDNLNKTGWTAVQNRLYKSTIKVIQGLRLARLASEGITTEPIRRREAINTAARRLRQVYSSYNWDMPLLCWLHKVLMDNLSEQLLSEYLEILRTLRAKIPNLIDKLLARVSPFHARTFGSAVEQFNQLLKKHWDPINSALNQQKPKKLPGNALILVVPSSPNQPPISSSHRSRFWHSQLSCLGKVVNVSPHSVPGVHKIAIDECLDQIFSITRNKVIELKAQAPDRPIILVGWMIGALIACHVALEEEVNAVICFGFPLTGVNGSRGDLDDPLLDSKVPTLFAIGQNANTCSMDDIEDFRERMKAETGLVIVGGADDMLRISATKKRVENVTQSMVDRCLVDEVSDFLTSILSPLYEPRIPVSQRNSYAQSSVQHSSTDDTKRKRRKPREYSPEISPVRRKPRQIIRQNVQKVSTSSTSSETSSTGSCTSENINAHKEVKKKSHRKVGRPPSNILYKRPKSLSHKLKNVSEEQSSTAKLDPLPKPLESRDAKMKKSLDPAKTLQLVNEQKNAPVDVEKAFGKDSSFLPRPLTPPDLETEPFVPQEESKQEDITTSTITTIDSMLNSTVSTKPKIVSVSPASLATLLGAPGHKISYLKPISSDIKQPQMVAKIADDFPKSQVQLIEKHSFVNTINTKTTTTPKIITAAGLNIQRNITPKTVMASTSQDSACIVSSSDLNTPKVTKTVHFRRMIMRGSHSPKILPKLSNHDQEPQSCNLSLLSEIAGTKEPILQSEGGQSSSGATLVKLTSAKEIKRMRVVEVTPQRIETPEEQAEKQMAIRALNCSLDGDLDTFNIKEPTYSTFYPRSDSVFMHRPSSSFGYSSSIQHMPHNYRARCRRPRGSSSFTAMGTRARRPRMPQIFFP